RHDRSDSRPRPEYSAADVDDLPRARIPVRIGARADQDRPELQLGCERDTDALRAGVCPETARVVMNRRRFFRWSAAAFGAGALTRASGRLQAQGATERPGATDSAAPCGELPASIRDLRPMTAGIAPISDDERHTRLEKARRLMADNRTAAICLEGGS